MAEETRNAVSLDGPLFGTPEFVDVLYHGRSVGTRAHVIRMWPDRPGAWASYCGRLSMQSRADRASFSFGSTCVTQRCRRCLQCIGVRS